MTTRFDTELLEIVTRGARFVWNDIASDVGDLGVDDAEAEVEVCLDADRLKTFGYADENAAMELLLEEGTFSDLCKAIAKSW